MRLGTSGALWPTSSSGRRSSSRRGTSTRRASHPSSRCAAAVAQAHPASQLSVQGLAPPGLGIIGACITGVSTASQFGTHIHPCAFTPDLVLPRGMPGPLHTALVHGRHPLTGALARPPPPLQVRDFSMIFDAYSQFEESLISALIERQAQQQARAELEARQAGAADGKGASSAAAAAAGTQLELDMRLERLERLMERRPELLSSVLLRQNPHSVHEWLKRAGLFESEPAKAIQTYAAAVKTVDPQKAVGKPAALWLAFARFYEQHGDLKNARVILRKAAAVPYRSVEELASVWQVRGGRWPSGCGAPRSQRQIGEPRTRASGDARRGLRMQGGCSSGHLTLSPDAFPRFRSPSHSDPCLPVRPRRPALDPPPAHSSLVLSCLPGLGRDGAAEQEARRGTGGARRGNRDPPRLQARQGEGRARPGPPLQVHAPLGLLRRPAGELAAERPRTPAACARQTHQRHRPRAARPPCVNPYSTQARPPACPFSRRRCPHSSPLPSPTRLVLALPQESLAGFDATRATYEKMIELKIVTPQVGPPQSRL
eukprot:scaffold24159_cov117-Isochrysis_galbana.AAC.5